MKRNILFLLFTITVGFTTYADEYLPLVREGVKWICLETKFYSSQDFSEELVDTRFYTIEFEGDSVIDGITYKKCYRYSDTNWAYDGYIIPCSKIKPMALLREEDHVVYAYAKDNNVLDHSLGDYAYWAFENYSSNGQHEIKLYEFRENGVFNFEGYKPFLNQESEMYSFNSMEEGLFVEGVGFDSDIYGDLLMPFWEGPYSLGMIYSYIGLHHIEDANGNIIYKGAAYTEPATGNIDGDLNGDGIIDVEDVNILINKILKLE